MAKLHELYKTKVRLALQQMQGYTSVMQVPAIEKITLNMGVGEAALDKKKMASAVADLALIAGQKPIVTVAKKSIAGFKIRQGYPIGCKVTLRRQNMWSFLERLVCIAMPRIRDFRGLNPNSFDSCGNYSLGIKEHIIFPEIDYDKVDQVRGLDVCITTSARTDAEAKHLLTALGFPFRQ